MDYLTEPLSEHHTRAGFSCGEPALDAYLAERALREMRHELTRCYVYCNAQGHVLGYYTLSAHTFCRGVLSGTKQRGIPPTYAVPAVLLGRLAVCRERKGVGLGGQLLVDALRRTVDLAEIVGVYALAVEAKYASAVAFYKHYEFIPFRDDPEKLFLPMKTVRDAVASCRP